MNINVFFFVKYEINFQFSYNNDTTTAVKIYFSKNRMRALINSIIHNMQFSFDDDIINMFLSGENM